MEVEALRKKGKLIIQQVDPAELSPGEFAARVRRRVEEGARMVVIDSLNGYLYAMPDERLLVTQLHELLAYLGQQGVITLLLLTQHGVVGNMNPPVDLSYLADTVILLRYFEFNGAMKKAISVVKKRTGSHETTIREFTISADGIKVGEPLSQFHGVMTGVPTYQGGTGPLLKPDAPRP